jgi:hypothetical protein
VHFLQGILGEGEKKPGLQSSHVFSAIFSYCPMMHALVVGVGERVGFRVGATVGLNSVGLSVGEGVGAGVGVVERPRMQPVWPGFTISPSGHVLQGTCT